MTAWTSDQLDSIGRADELQIASRRDDGSLRPYVTIWSVRSGDSIYLRSAHGPENGWFRRALASGTGRVRSGGVEADVSFEVPEASMHPDLDAAYHAKYDRYGARMVGFVVGEIAASATLRVTPID